MKTLNKIILMLAVVVLSACPKNNNNNDQNQNVYVNCVNCSGVVNGPEFLFTDSTELNNSFTLHMSLMGTTNTANYGAYYSGPAAVSRGDLQMSQGLYQGYCLIPAGSYSLGTVEAGTYQNGILQGLRIIAQGPATLILRMQSAQISSQNNRDANGYLLSQQRLFSANTVIESVNGQVCNWPVTLR
jgi:hypothetical protein